MNSDAPPHSSSSMLDLVFPWQPVKRQFRPGDEFFTDGDVLCGVSQKQLLPDVTDQHQENKDSVASFVCHVVRCNKIFDSIARYESHYNSTHRHICSVCHRSMPSSHLLELHLMESHDSMFQIMASRQCMYQCLLEDCAEKFMTPCKRHDHLLTQHKYPSNFRFNRHNKAKHSKPKKTKDVRNTAEKRENTSKDKPQGNNKDNQSESSNNEINQSQLASQQNGELISQSEKMSEEVLTVNQPVQQPRRIFSYRVPDNISFGQGVPRGFSHSGKSSKRKGKKKHWYQHQTQDGATTINIEEVHMKDLSDALE